LLSGKDERGRHGKRLVLDRLRGVRGGKEEGERRGSNGGERETHGWTGSRRREGILKSLYCWKKDCGAPGAQSSGVLCEARINNS